MCAIWFSSPNKKISLNHVNKAFNQAIQADILVIYIRDEKFYIMKIICPSTNYGEHLIVDNRSGNIVVSHLENDWIYGHGSHEEFGADLKFCNGFLKKLLRSLNIGLPFCPSHSSYKNGNVERNNGILKRVLEKLAKENTLTDASMIIARDSVMNNMFLSNSCMSSFQIVRGCSPSIVGVPSSVIPTELLEVHKQIKAARAINKLIRPHEHDTLSQCFLEKDTPLWIYYKSSDQNEKMSEFEEQ